MKSEIKHLPESRVKITIEATPEEFAKYFQASLAKFAENLKLDGFRMGKAPLSLVEKHIGKESVTADALDEAIPDLYYQAILEHKVHPVDRADMSIDSFEDEVLKFTAEVDVLPKVDIKDWKSIKVKKDADPVVTDEDVNRVIDQMRKERAQLNEIDRALEKGDFASISYEGSVDGVKREDMASKSHPMIVGEGGLIPGFEDELIGMKKDEEKSFEIVFPKDYHEKSLVKKKAKFTVKIDNLKGVELPEVNADFAKGFGLKSADELLKKIREQLTNMKTQEAKRDFEEKVLTELQKRTKAETPKSLIEKELDRFIENIQTRFGLDDKTLPIYFEKQHKTIEQYRSDMRENAKKNVVISLALSQLMQEMDIKPEKKDSIQLAIDKLVESATK